jgi:shikimate dehydrogenase
MSASITARTALLGVVGDPVRHSLSPAMHNAAIGVLGLDWVYLALPVRAADLVTVLRGLEALDCRGLNVTLPHKQAAAAAAADLSPLALRLGAVNTLVRRSKGGWYGTNTDVEGFLAPLRGEGVPGSGARALVLGCGGSARAVVAGLAELGPASLRIAGRHPERLASFAASCAAWTPHLDPLHWSEDGLADAIAEADLVVNTTPVGMGSEAIPLTARELDALRPGTLVYDLIYTPRPTALLREACSRGCRGLDGLEMLVQQGAASLRLWTGQTEVPVAAMRAAALGQLEAP